MPRNTHPASYADIKPILDAALAAGGAAYTPKGRDGEPSRGAAIAWRARAYAFRHAIKRHQAADSLGLGPNSTPYDAIILRIDPHNDKVVLINKHDPLGDLVGLDGKPLTVGAVSGDLTVAREESADPLLEQARKQAADLGINLED